jgi:enterochelin esterase family protein
MRTHTLSRIVSIKSESGRLRLQKSTDDGSEGAPPLWPEYRQASVHATHRWSMKPVCSEDPVSLRSKTGARRLRCGSLLVAALIAPVSIVSAQEIKSATNAPARRAERPAPLVSPELQPDGAVTFRFKAGKATEVKVSGQFGPDVAMTKDDKDVWSATVPSVPAGVHEYRFVVDGLSVIDPQNSMIKPQRWPSVSILHVPANPPAPWDLQDIPHGTLHEHTYKSRALDNWRRIIVYTPPGASGRLPVLYLSHGYSDNEASWSVHGKAHWILDSLIAGKKAVPMIVVMMDAHALPPGAAGFGEYGPANSAALCRELSEDIIPLVEGSYKVAARPRSRAFAGLSMGGSHALTVAMNHHDKFNWIGAFSSAPPPTNSIATGLNASEAVNRDLKLFWIACGKKDFLFQRNGEFTALLKTKGIRYEYVETEGDHSWPVWRRNLVEFAPKLFR